MQGAHQSYIHLQRLGRQVIVQENELLLVFRVGNLEEGDSRYWLRHVGVMILNVKKLLNLGSLETLKSLTQSNLGKLPGMRKRNYTMCLSMCLSILS